MEAKPKNTYTNYLQLFGLIFLLGFSWNLWSQKPTPKFRTFDENSGFQTTNYISDIKVDHKGLVWIVDFSGISTYDGSQFKSINTSSVSHASLLRLYEHKDQQFVIDFLSEIFIVESDSLIESTYNKEIEKIKPRNGYADLYIDEDGDLHIAYYRLGYIKISKEGELSYPLKGKFVNRRGELCLLRKGAKPFIISHIGDSSASKDRYFYLIDENYNIIDSTEAPSTKFRNPVSTAKVIDSQNDWIICNGRGNAFTIKDRQLKRIDFPYMITNLLADGSGGVTFSTLNNGIFFYENIEQLEEYQYQLFSGESATAAATDQEGGIWVYSPDRGLIHIPYPRFKYYREENKLLLNNHVFGIEKAGQKLLASSEENRLSLIDIEANYLDSMVLDFAKEKAIYDIYYDRSSNELWVSLRGEIYYRNLKNGRWIKLKTLGFDDSNTGEIVRIVGFSEQLNAIVAIMNNQFFFVRDHQIQYISPTYPDNIYVVKSFRDSLFVGAEDGLYVQHRETVEYLGDKSQNFADRVYSINQLHDELYFSIKNQGLFYLDDQGYHSFNYQGEELNKGAVFKIDDNSLLILSKEGSFHYRFDGKEKSWKAYQRLPKIIAGNFVLRDSTVYWGTWKDGIFATDLKDIFLKELKPLPLRFVDVKIDGESQDFSQTNQEVSYNKGFFEFHYQAISFQNWEVLYRYRLLGLDDSWTNTDERKVQFTTLPAGDYTFQIQVKKGQQFWSEALEYSFTVNPPFWKTWWFIAASIILLALLSYFSITYRIKRVKHQKDLVIDRLEAEQRALRAQMDPHFVFNIVSSAQYLVMKEENDTAILFLNKFSKLMRNILDYSNTNYISLDEELKFLKDYAELEQIRLENSFEVIWNISDDLELEKIHLPPFVIQPFLENSIHHGLKNKKGDKYLKLSLSRSGKYLVIEVEDNGIGRKKAAEFISKAKRIRKSHGLRIIQERLELYNGRKDNIEISDLHPEKDESGTLVKLKLKIKKHEGINS